MTPGRSNLRLSDLKAKAPTASKLFNVKLPVELATAIDRLSKKLGANKTETIVALLNEGLEIVGKKKR